MVKKYYAVKKGYDFTKGEEVKDYISDSWNQCAPLVKGVKGAIYKSFESKMEAENFLKEGSALLKKGIDSYPENCIHAYVDGSYNVNTMEYGYGFVVERKGIVEYVENGRGIHKDENNIRQIAGELMASIKACDYALKAGEKEIVIFHDYEGVCHHATGFWGRKDESSKNYYETMQHYMKSGLKIVFVKVDSHTGDIFNEVADEKSKETIGVPPTKAVAKYLKRSKIYTATMEVRNQLYTIAWGEDKNIVCIGHEEECNDICSEISDEFHISPEEKFHEISVLFNEDEDSAIKLLKKYKKQELLDYVLFLLKSNKV